MKRSLLLIIALLQLTPALALTINVYSDKTGLDINDLFTISYEISLNQPTEINYTIGLKTTSSNMTLYSESGTISSLTASIEHNITNTEAGEYDLFLQVLGESLNILELGPDKIIINASPSYDLNVFNNLYLVNETAEGTVNVYNTGNTPLSITAYFTGAQSELSIVPQSFLLKPNSTRGLLVSAKKPEADYTALINFIISHDDFMSIESHDVNIVIPVVNLSLDNVAHVQSNVTTVFVNVTNNGNMDVNASLSIRTFTFSQGFNVYNYDVNALAGELTQLTYTLPLTTLVSAALTYEGLNGTVELKKELSVVDRIPFSLSQDQMLVIAIVGVIVVAYVYLKLTRKKKFR